MPTITIIRKKEWMLRYRRVEIFLDGQNLGYFPTGIKKEIDLPVGEHKLKARMRWYRSKEFNFTLFNKEKKSVEISTNKFVLVPVFIIPVFYVLLETFTKNHELFILHSFTIMIALYIIIFLRNNYLIIEEDKII